MGGILDVQADELNEMLKQENSSVLDMLSDRGKGIFFPKKGIVAQSAEAKGKNLNATAGIAHEEDESPMRLSPIADKVLLKPTDVFPYASSYGVKELRDKWRQLIYKKNPFLRSEISVPVVTAALTHGLTLAGYLFVNPGDKILIHDKFWENYSLIFENAYGAVIETFNTFKADGFDVESFRKKMIEPGKKIVLLNFPNNPTGYTPTLEEAIEIIKAIKDSAEMGNKVVAIIDDAYFGLVYEKGIITESLFSMLSNLDENVLAVKIDGSTKEDYVWGLRVGFITFGIKNGSKALYTVLEEKSAGAVRGTISNVSNLSQNLVLNAYSSPDYESEKLEKKNLLSSRYHKVKEVLKD